MHEEALKKQELKNKEREAEKALKKEATEYVDNFKKNGNKYITIRIRDGFIGKELSEDGRVLQPYRSRPRGTMVAFKDPDDENELKIGISYLKNTDKDLPIVGVEKAIKYALEEDKKYMAFSNSGDNDKVKVWSFVNTYSYKSMSKNDRELLEFFIVRALCYFYPDLYSYSRGTEKIEYPNYDKIHENRKRVLGD